MAYPSWSEGVDRRRPARHDDHDQNWSIGTTSFADVAATSAQNEWPTLNHHHRGSLDTLPTLAGNVPVVPEYTVHNSGKDASCPDSIDSWLSHIGLHNYVPSFMDAGYSNLSFLQDAEIEDIHVLATDVGMKLPHKKRFIQQWKALVQQPCVLSAEKDSGLPDCNELGSENHIKVQIESDTTSQSEAGEGTAQWFWIADHGQQIPYEVSVSDTIERAFVSGKPTVRIQIQQKKEETSVSNAAVQQLTPMVTLKTAKACKFLRKCRYRSTCTFHHGDPSACECTSTSCPKGHANRCRKALPPGVNASSRADKISWLRSQAIDGESISNWPISRNSQAVTVDKQLNKTSTPNILEFLIDFEKMQQISINGTHVKVSWYIFSSGRKKLVGPSDTEILEAKSDVYIRHGCICTSKECDCTLADLTSGGQVDVKQLKYYGEAKANCGGTGIIKNTCETCKGATFTTEDCFACGGGGRYHGGRRSVMCHSCHGTGKFEKTCKHCMFHVSEPLRCKGCKSCGGFDIERDEKLIGMRKVVRFGIETEKEIIEKEKAKLEQERLEAEQEKESARKARQDADLRGARLKKSCDLAKAISLGLQWFSEDDQSTEAIKDTEKIAFLEDGFKAYQDMLSSNTHQNCDIEVNQTAYSINFRTLEQVNVQTKFTRKISRKLNENNEAHWYWAGDRNSEMLQYDSDISKILEQAFQQYMLARVKAAEAVKVLQVSDWEVNFESMQEKNTKTGTIRQLKRVLQSSFDTLPDHWSSTGAKGYSLEILSTSSDEYLSVKKNFYTTMPQSHCELVKVSRVENPSLWKYYQMRKKRMAELLGSEPEEVEAWHGTSEAHPELIYTDKRDGFLITMSSKGMWGRGLYFARNAQYSHNYAHGKNVGRTRLLLLVKLLVGSSVKLSPDKDIKHPPKKLSTDGTLCRHDTVTGTTKNSTVYIVYENGRAYPCWLVEYKVHDTPSY